MVVDGEGEGEGGKKLPVVGSGGQTDDLAQYHLDDYDDDVDEEGARAWLTCVVLYHSFRRLSGIGPFTDIKGLTFYRDNADDPYITLKEVGPTPRNKSCSL